MEMCIESIIECNLYQYTGNNPVNFVDPDGYIRVKDAGWSAVGLLGNGAGGAVGLAIIAAGGPVAWAVGGVIYAKSLWGVAVNSYELGNAVMENSKDISVPESHTTMFRAGSELVPYGDQNTKHRIADAAELAVDLMAGSFKPKKPSTFHEVEATNSMGYPIIGFKRETESLANTLNRNKVYKENTVNMFQFFQTIDYIGEAGLLPSTNSDDLAGSTDD